MATPRVDMGDPENAELGRLLGIEPRSRWYLMGRDRDSYYISFDHQSEAAAHLGKNLAEYPEGLYFREGVHVVEGLAWPPFSRSLDACLPVAEAMKAKGYRLVLHISDEYEGWVACFEGGEERLCQFEETPAKAITLAAIGVLDSTRVLPGDVSVWRPKFLIGLVSLGLTPRVFHAIKNAALAKPGNINSLRQPDAFMPEGRLLEFDDWCEFVMTDPDEIRKIRNFGPIGLAELLEKVAAYRDER